MWSQVIIAHSSPPALRLCLLVGQGASRQFSSSASSGQALEQDAVICRSLALNTNHFPALRDNSPCFQTVSVSENQRWPHARM